jgi:hypothetical protein
MTAMVEVTGALPATLQQQITIAERMVAQGRRDWEIALRELRRVEKGELSPGEARVRIRFAAVREA